MSGYIESNTSHSSPYSSLLKDMSRMHSLLSEYQSQIEMTCLARSSQTADASSNRRSQETDLFILSAAMTASESLPALHGIFVPSNESFNARLLSERTMEQVLTGDMAIARQRLDACRGLMEKAVEAVNQISEFRVCGASLE
ncbi:hypothetical protein FRC09_007764 [Ceratobasidium sp. 395]|nr:hypothetical protein FRC09_007764 [Ceratobasidium sp. 395]